LKGAGLHQKKIQQKCYGRRYLVCNDLKVAIFKWHFEWWGGEE
jgi:hypothetical protein